MFRRIEDPVNETISIHFDGRTIQAVDREPIAIALLAAGEMAIRNSPVSGEPRGPFCMMGACFECLVDVEGVSVQACLTPAYDGMRISRLAPIGTVPDPVDVMAAQGHSSNDNATD